MKIFEAFDCDNCDTKKTQLMFENENVIELYNSIPHNYEGNAGLRIFDANAVKFLFKVFDVSEDLQDDYYKKLIYFHGEIVDAHGKMLTKKRKKEEEDRKWKELKAKSKSRRVH